MGHALLFIGNQIEFIKELIGFFDELKIVLGLLPGQWG